MPLKKLYKIIFGKLSKLLILLFSLLSIVPHLTLNQHQINTMIQYDKFILY